MQALLYEHGIRYVITRFARAKQFAAPYHESITWEAGVGLLERGEAPVAWNQPASSPRWDFSGPVLPLHWGNLLHHDPALNSEIVAGWVELLLAGTAGLERILVKDLAACWSQAAAFYFGRLEREDGAIIVNLRALPKEMPGAGGGLFLKFRGCPPRAWDCRGGRLVAQQRAVDITTLQLLPDEKNGVIRLRGR